MGAVSYDSNSLQTATIITNMIDHHSMGEFDLKMAAVAHAFKSVTTGLNIPTKTIGLKGTLLPAVQSISSMDDLEDTFKGYFIGHDKNLDVQHSSGTRRYVVTPQSVVIDRPAGLGFGTFDVKLACASPFGIDITQTAMTSGSAVTTSTATWSVTVGGSAQYQFPTITITLNSGTQMTGQSMSIGNNMNSQICTITRNWSAGDIVVIDSVNNLVTVNGSEVDFSGAIPFFEKGAGSVSYSDTFLTRNINYDVKQYKYWN